MVPVLAHQGGWDEILLVVAPLLLFALLLAGARRRVNELDHDDTTGESDSGEAGDTAPATDGANPEVGS